MDRDHDPDKRETHAEGGKNGVNFELALVSRAPHERTQQHLVDHPIAQKGQRRHDQHRQNGADGIRDEYPEGGQRAKHKKLAIREIHDSGHAILHVQPKSDQRVGAAKQQTCDDDIHLTSPHDAKSGRHEPRVQTPLCRIHGKTD